MSPLAESWVKPSQLHHMEPFYPLHVYVCERCFLVQLEEFESPDHIFSDYAYFSSYSESWLQHAKSYVEMAMKRFQLSDACHVVEIACNDGYLLRNFVEKGIPCLGIEPAANVAEVAVERGIPTRVRFFGEQTARDLLSEELQADLIVGNNVLAHVPALNDFVEG
jgi:2-polyprenyl-3-methyl-5-hydroxy-6-metoxy-1,4-benzoquinol methylase